MKIKVAKWGTPKNIYEKTLFLVLLKIIFDLKTGFNTLHSIRLFL
jgi:hypothetical protein